MDSATQISIHGSFTNLESTDSVEFAALALPEELKILLPDATVPDSDTGLVTDFCNLGLPFINNLQVNPSLPCHLKNVVCSSESSLSLEELDFLEAQFDFKVHENEHRDVFMENGDVGFDGFSDSEPPEVPIQKTNFGYLSENREKTQNNEDFAEKNGLHIATVSVDLIQNRRPFKCLHLGCDKTFKNPQTMKMHHKTHCSDDILLQKSSGLLLQASKARQNKKIPCRCPVCGRAFVGLYELRRHFGRKHSEGEKMHNCKKCGKKFYIEVDLRDHEKLCGEPVGCKCGMKFAFRCNLLAHKKTHPECLDAPLIEDSKCGRAVGSAFPAQNLETPNGLSRDLALNRPSLGLSVPTGVKVEDMCGLTSCHARTNLLIHGIVKN